jgi:hypothetical protein
MPLGHLIALISNAHLRKPDENKRLWAQALFLLLLGTVNIAYRKTSLHRDRPNLEPAVQRARSYGIRRRDTMQAKCSASRCPRMTRSSVRRLGHIPSSRCQEIHRSRRRNLDSSTLDAMLRIRGLVEPDGIEPTTSCLQSRRSPN